MRSGEDTAPRFCAGLPLIVLILILLSTSTRAATRIAIVNPDATAEAAKLVDLAMANLGREKSCEVLERANIERLLQEQGLSLARFVDAERAVKAGQVLRVDLFAVVEAATARAPFGIVVFDARNGVRYADSAVASSDLKSAAAQVTDIVRRAAAKSRQASKGLRTISLLSVRNADLPRSFDSVCETTGLLLERELVNGPEVAVLERRRLEQINRERAVTATAGDVLLLSLRTIDLEIARADEGLRASAVLRGFHGEPELRATAMVGKADGAALSRALARAIAEALRMPALPASLDRAAEAQRFGRESELRARHRDFAAALRAIEAAHALDPAETNFQQRLVQLLPDAAIEILDPGGQHWDRDLPRQPTDDEVALAVALGHRAADVLQDFCAQMAATTKPAEPIPPMARSEAYGQLNRLLEKLAQARLQGSPHSELESLARKERFNRIEIIEPFLRNRVHDRESFHRFSAQEFWFALSSHFGVFDPAQWCRDSALAAQRWVGVAQQFNPPDGSGNYAPLKHLISLFGATKVMQHSNLFAPLWSACARADDPVLQAYATVGPAMPFLREAKRPAEDRLSRVHALRLGLQEEIVRQPPSTNSARRNLFDILDEVLSCVRNDREGWKEYRDACRFALDQREAQQGLFNISLSEVSPATRGGPAEARQLATEILKLLEESPGALPGIERESVIANCRYHRDGFASGVPLPPAPGWQRATKLFEADPERNKLGFVFKPVLSGNNVFIAGFGLEGDGNRDQALQLVRVPLAGGAPAFLGRAPFQGLILESMRRAFEYRWPKEWKQWNVPRSQYVRDDLPNTPHAACLADGNYFLATHAGLLAFPTNGGAVQRFSVTNGLPSDHVHSLAYLDGRLFVGAGEIGRAGYFLELNPRTRELKMLASSRREGAASPLDDGPPFHPGFLLADEARHRVLMLAGFNSKASLGGIWSYEPGSGRFTHVAPFAASFPDVHTFWLWSGQAAAGVIAACRLDTTLFIWNAHNDEFILQHERRRQTNIASAIWPVRKVPTGGNMQHAPVMLLDGWLWWANPFQRASLETKQVEEFPALETNYEFAPTECLELLEDGKRVLAADRFSVWLLELSSREPSSVKASSPNTSP